MLRWLIVSTLLVQSIIAASSQADKTLEDYDLWRRGKPSTSTGSTYHADCVKDILILWDNSRSVGLSAFQDSVIPFLKNFVNSARLNVGSDGTHIGIITFSSPGRTHTLLKIGDITSPEQLTSYLDNLNYKELSGGSTTTGKAFEIANSTFNETSPLNHRPEIADVILLFTDGEPRARTRVLAAQQEQLAHDCASSLKTRDVKVIGLAIGEDDVLAQFLPQIRTWSSPGSLFMTEFSALNNVLDQLVADACKPAGDCGCRTIIPDVQYANNGEMAPVQWVQPTFSCTENRPDYVVQITPQGTRPGQKFGKGKHIVTYTFNYNDAGKRRILKCPIIITVAECSCPAQQTTVEGVIGPNERTGLAKWKVPVPNCPARLVRPASASAVETRQFSKGEHLVQYVYRHRSGRNSFRLRCNVNIKMEDCKCPIQTKIVKGAVGPNEISGVARWRVPVPSCAAKLISPKTYGRAIKFDSKRFREGNHREEYIYEHENGLRITCGVNIQMEACGCRPATQTVQGKIDNENAKATVSWRNPRPKCDAQEDRRNPRSSTGDFSVGQHTLTYSYTYAPNSANPLRFKCRVNIVIKGPLCRETRYDPATHICCCGKLYEKKVGYECCGLRYYDTRRQKCCNEKRSVLVERRFLWRNGGRCPS